MNIFRLQLMADLLKEMAVAVPVLEVTGTVSEYGEDEIEVTRTISKFSLDDWTNAVGDNAERAGPACGYSACAVGHAMFDVRFNALGLVQYEGSPMYEGETDWDAVEQFFDISFETASTLFSPCHYSVDDEDVSAAKPADVLERVQFLLLHGEEELADQYN